MNGAFDAAVLSQLAMTEKMNRMKDETNRKWAFQLDLVSFVDHRNWLESKQM
jgi:hypothetical protein